MHHDIFINPGKYEKVERTIDIMKANYVGMLFSIPFVLLLALAYYLFWPGKFTLSHVMNKLESLTWWQGLSSIFNIFWIAVAGIILHELIHGFTWAFFAKRGFNSIKFGILWKYLTPYCHCTEPLSVRAYLTGAITPALFLGIIPSIFAVISGNTPLLIFGFFFTVAAIGDFMILHLLWKEESTDFVIDHPSEAGCFVYRKKINN